jgi:16S rRNA methyltransferase gidB
MMDILQIYNVSRETKEKIEAYKTLVLEWNCKFNLISKSSVEHIWERHILDSVQLYKYIRPTDKILLDLGSGAGFPGMVLAIMAKQLNPELSINLVESIGKKTLFLNAVKDELKLNVNILHDRIENIKMKNVDIITSRALAALSKLLDYSKPFCKTETNLIFPKGEHWADEIETAQKQWYFKYKTENSATDKFGKILCISELRRKR